MDSRDTFFCVEPQLLRDLALRQVLEEQQVDEALWKPESLSSAAYSVILSSIGSEKVLADRVDHSRVRLRLQLGRA